MNFETLAMARQSALVSKSPDSRKKIARHSKPQRTTSFSRRITRFLNPPTEANARKSQINKHVSLGGINLSKIVSDSNTTSNYKSSSSSEDQGSDSQTSLDLDFPGHLNNRQSDKRKASKLGNNLDELEEVNECDSLLNDSEISLLNKQQLSPKKSRVVSIESPNRHRLSRDTSNFLLMRKDVSEPPQTTKVMTR